MDCKRDELLKKLGAAQHQAPSAWRLVTVEVEEKEARSPISCARTNCARCDGAKAAISYAAI